MRVGMILGPRQATGQPLEEVSRRQLSQASSAVTSRTRLDSNGRRAGVDSRDSAGLLEQGDSIVADVSASHLLWR